MTLDNLQYALYLNNRIILDRIKNLKNTIDDIINTDIDELKKLIEDINDTDLANINQLITDLDTDLSNHTSDTVIHVTQDDKDLWNATLQNAKDYAKKLFDSVTSFTIEIVDTLPTEDIKSMTIYFMRNGRDNESDYYEEYMYVNNKWEIIGSTFVNLEPYLLKADFEKYQKEITDKFTKYNTSDEIVNILKDYLLTQTFNDTIKNYVTTQTFNDTIKNYTTTETLQKLLEEYAKTEDIHTHENKDIIDKLSESADGNLLFNGQEIKGGSGSDITISEEDNNAIQQKDDGIFVEDKTEQINNIQTLVNQVSIAQKTVNTRLDYFYGILNKINILNYSSSDCPIIIKYNQQENNNIEYDFSTGILKLKANKTYKISIEMRFSLSSGGGQISYRIYKKDGTMLSSSFGVKNTSSNNYTWSDKDYDLIITTKEDMEIYACIYDITLTSSNITIKSIQSSISIQEIGKQIIIDPVEHINTTNGIEDTPVGHIISHIGNTAPKHYLICDGTKYNISDYPYLAEHFKTEFGNYNYFGGDGITTFAVPDLRGEFLRGTGENSHENQGSGVNVGEHQDATEHKYYYLSDYGRTQYAKYTSNNYYPQDVGKLDSVIHQNGVYLHCDGGTWLSNSSWTSIPELYTSRPTNTSVLYCIKYEPTYYMTVGEYTVQGFDDYSEEEKIIGRWINGKPLYRKTLILTAPSAIGTTVMYKIDNSLEVKNLYGYIDNGSTENPQCIPFNYYNDNNNFIFTRVRWVSSNQQIGITIGDSKTLISKLVYITLEYTKTTDTENSFTPDMLSTIVMSGNKQKDLTEEELNNLITDTINLLNE